MALTCSVKAALTFNLKCIGTKWLLKPTLFCFCALAVCFWCNFGKFWLQRPWETLFIFMSEGLLHFPVMTQQTCQANTSGSSLGFGQKCRFAQCQWNRAEDLNQGDRRPWLLLQLLNRHSAFLHRQDKRGHFVLHCLDTNTCRIAVFILVFPNRRATLNLKYFYIIGSW